MNSKLPKIENYYKWSSSRLVDNRNRGIFAEWLVGQALNAIQNNTSRREWDAVDLRVNGVTIEIKCSGRSQSWGYGEPSTPRWSIQKNKRVWNAETDEVEVFDNPKRNADIYIFCLHDPIPATNENVADPRCWSFWVIASKTIDKELGNQKSVGIRTLKSLTESISWSELPVEFEKVAEGLN